MRIPPLDLVTQYKSQWVDLDYAVSRVIKRGHFILGMEVQTLQQEIAAYCGTKHAVGVASGTDALLLALIATGIEPGDEVITSPFSFVATASAIVRAGAIPVFVDIDAYTFNLDPNKVQEALTEKTRAILPVHLYGQMANMDALGAIAKEHDLDIIEDAAQAIGAMWWGQKAGSLGAAGCLSFYPTKNLGAWGDGGMVLTDDDEIAWRVDVLRRQGSPQKYRAQEIGINSRLDELQAAILRVKLKRLDLWQFARSQIAGHYLQELSGLDLVLPVPEGRQVCAWHQFTIRVRDKRRDALQQYLAKHDISTTVYYPMTIPEQKPFERYQQAPTPIATQATAEVLSLPIYPELTAMQQEYVIETIRAFYD